MDTQLQNDNNYDADYFHSTIFRELVNETAVGSVVTFLEEKVTSFVGSDASASERENQIEGVMSRVVDNNYVNLTEAAAAYNASDSATSLAIM